MRCGRVSQWRGNHTFCCGVPVQEAVQFPCFSLVIFLGLSTLFLLFVTAILENIGWLVTSILFAVLAIASLGLGFATFLTEPGILPQRKPEAGVQRPPAIAMEEMGMGPLQLEVARALKAAKTRAPHSSSAPFQYCTECNVWQVDQETGRIQAVHSHVLQRCVLRLDHICTYIGQAIGFRNYGVYFGFVTALTACSGFAALVSTYVGVMMLMGSLGYAPFRLQPDLRTIFPPIVHLVATVCVAVLAWGVAITMARLVSYHYWISSHGLTTREHLKQLRRPSTASRSLFFHALATGPSQLHQNGSFLLAPLPGTDDAWEDADVRTVSEQRLAAWGVGEEVEKGAEGGGDAGINDSQPLEVGDKSPLIPQRQSGGGFQLGI